MNKIVAALLAVLVAAPAWADGVIIKGNTTFDANYPEAYSGQSGSPAGFTVGGAASDPNAGLELRAKGSGVVSIPSPATIGGTLGVTGAINTTSPLGYEQNGVTALSVTPPAGYTTNGFTLLGSNACKNVTNVVIGVHCVGYWSGGAGLQTFDGMGGGTGLIGNENTFDGYASGTQATTANEITATGHNSAGHEVDGAVSDYYGNDSGKWGLHNYKTGVYGTASAKFLWNLLQDNFTGTNAGMGSQIAPSVSGAANNGSGLIRLTVNTTTGVKTGDAVFVSQVGGTTEANTTGTPWYITVVDGTHIDLQGSTFTNTYTSGGLIYDMPGGFINQTVSGAVNNGAGLVRLTVPNTFNMSTGSAAHVAGITGTTEANGTWTITVIDSGCTAGCRVDLQGSTFVHAYVSGGNATILNGPSNVAVYGYSTLSTNLTGANGNLAVFGAGAAGNSVSLANTSVFGAGVGSTTLGTTGGNVGIILEGVDNTTDVASSSASNSVGIGVNLSLLDSSVQIGYRAGFIGNLVSGARDVLIGFEVGFGMTAPVQVSAYGNQVASVVCKNPGNVLLLGTDQNTDCGSAGENNAIHIGAGGPDIISATGTGTPATSITHIAGAFTVGNEITAAKITDSATAPGAGEFKVTVVAGTTAGTCKLIARAGTSTTPVTIIDNVGSGC